MVHVSNSEVQQGYQKTVFFYDPEKINKQKQKYAFSFGGRLKVDKTHYYVLQTLQGLDVEHNKNIIDKLFNRPRHSQRQLSRTPEGGLWGALQAHSTKFGCTKYVRKMFEKQV